MRGNRILYQRIRTKKYLRLFQGHLLAIHGHPHCLGVSHLFLRAFYINFPCYLPKRTAMKPGQGTQNPQKFDPWNWFDCLNTSWYRHPELKQGTWSMRLTKLLYLLVEGSLEVKLPTIWTHEKQRWEESEKRREKKRRRKKIKKRKSPKKEDPGARKGRKVAKHCVFSQWFVAPEPAGQMRDEKLHAFVARSTFSSEKAKNTSRSEHFWKLRCRKSAHHCGPKHISKSTCAKHLMFGPLLEVEMSKKCTRLWREAHFEVKMHKAHHVRTTFGRSDLVSRGRRKRLCTLSKVRKTWGFCSMSKNDGRRGTFEEDLQRCIFCGRRSTRDMFIRDVWRSGRWFPESGRILEHQIFRFAEMILRDRCSTSYDLASIFRGRCNTLDRWSGKLARRIGTRPSALHSIFHFWCCQLRKLRKSRRRVSFSMLSSSKLEEVSQTCFCFGCCQVQKLRKSRRIASFSSLQIDR